MILDVIKQFNWVDVFIVITFIRTVYIAVKRGLPVEVFKLIGTVTALFLAIHYYTAFSDWSSERIRLDKVPLEFADFLCFLILAGLGYLFVLIFRSIFCRFIKMEAVPQLNKWGGLVIGLLRGYFLVSFLVFMLFISSIGYFSASVKKSYSGKNFFYAAVGTYNWLWDSIISRFSPDGDSNKTIPEIQERLEEK